MVLKGKSKYEIAGLLEIGVAILYRWIIEKAAGKIIKKWQFYSKIDPEKNM